MSAASPSSPASPTRVHATLPLARPQRPDWLRRHHAYCEAARTIRPDVVFLGDSLTQRWETAPKVWQNAFARHHAVQMGIDNDGTQQVLWRLDNGTLDGATPSVVVVLIGINNLGNDNASPEDVRDGVAVVLDRIRTLTPTSQILLLGLLPCGRPERNYGALVPATNALLASLGDGRRIHFRDVGDCLLVDRAISRHIQPDGVHLSAAGYARLARALCPALADLRW